MREEQFRQYLSNKYKNPRVISDTISRCKRVEKYEGNLDKHFEEDEGGLILKRLTYGKRDAELCREPKHSIKINGSKGYISIYEGTLSLHKAVTLYFDYKRNTE